MIKVTFALQLDQVGVPSNAARMWLDTSHDDIIQPGEEVTLGTIDGKLWFAERIVKAPTSGMQFLLKFIAPIGTKWSFIATAGDTTVFEFKDKQMTMTKEVAAGRLA
jgi:hypothetical protein